MSGPDGLEQRTADDAEHFEYVYDELDRIEQREEESVDDALLDLAQARMTSHFIDRILENTPC